MTISPSTTACRLALAHRVGMLFGDDSLVLGRLVCTTSGSFAIDMAIRAVKGMAISNTSDPLVDLA